MTIPPNIPTYILEYEILLNRKIQINNYSMLTLNICYTLPYLWQSQLFHQLLAMIYYYSYYIEGSIPHIGWSITVIRDIFNINLTTIIYYDRISPIYFINYIDCNAQWPSSTMNNYWDNVMTFKLLLNITWNSTLINYFIIISDHNCEYVTTAIYIYILISGSMDIPRPHTSLPHIYLHNKMHNVKISLTI